MDCWAYLLLLSRLQIVAINGNAVYDEMKKEVLVQLKSGGEIHMVVARKKCKTGGRSPKHTSL